MVTKWADFIKCFGICRGGGGTRSQPLKLPLHMLLVFFQQLISQTVWISLKQLGVLTILAHCQHATQLTFLYFSPFYIVDLFNFSDLIICINYTPPHTHTHKHLKHTQNELVPLPVTIFRNKSGFLVRPGHMDSLYHTNFFTNLQANSGTWPLIFLPSLMCISYHGEERHTAVLTDLSICMQNKFSNTLWIK